MDIRAKGKIIFMELNDHSSQIANYRNENVSNQSDNNKQIQLQEITYQS